jgi:hypothetical protein
MIRINDQAIIMIQVFFVQISRVSRKGDIHTLFKIFPGKNIRKKFGVVMPVCIVTQKQNFQATGMIIKMKRSGYCKYKSEKQKGTEAVILLLQHSKHLCVEPTG